MTTQATPDGMVRKTIELDSKYDWHVSRKLVEYPNGLRATTVTELGRTGGHVMPVKSRATYPNVGKVDSTMRQMSPEEEAALRVQVEFALRPAFTLPAFLKRPSTYAAAWPLSGMLLIGAQALARRR